MTVVLVINSGSSSLKYSLMDMAREVPLAEGLIERIGQETGEISHTVRRVADAGEPDSHAAHENHPEAAPASLPGAPEANTSVVPVPSHMHIAENDTDDEITAKLKRAFAEHVIEYNGRNAALKV